MDIKASGFDAPSFNMGISLPLSIGLRIHTIWVHLLKKFPTLSLEVSYQ